MYYEPIQYIDTNNPNSVYIGISNNGTNTQSKNWKIKRLNKIDNIWYTEYPNGDQSYSFIWDDRLTYTYE